MKLAAVSLLALLSLLASAQAIALVPATCSGTCTTTAQSPAFSAPVASITSGSTMAWISADTVHQVADGLGGSSCLDLPVPALASSALIRFVIERDGLHGQRLDASGNVAQDLVCNASRLPNGSFALAYRCLIHPEMRGTLVVS
jgi:hypothetical protein